MTAGAFDTLTSDELRGLIQQASFPTLSLYQPTHRGAVELEQDHLRFKNLVHTAGASLERRGIRRADASRLCDPLNQLLEDQTFWRHRLDGLAVFSAPGISRYYRLPFAVDERVVVADSAHIKPLLPATADGSFYILVLSLGSVRLIHATRFAAEEVGLDGLDIPTSLADALKYDDFEKVNLPRHPTGTGGRYTAHGHGPGDKNLKEEISRYFHLLSSGLTPLLASQNVPLVIAGVDYLHPLYKATSSYKNIYGRGLIGNFEGASVAELHRRSTEIIQPHFDSTRAAVVERYGAGISDGTSSCALDDVVAGAHQGRIDSLLIRATDECPGTYDPATGRVDVREVGTDADADLLDLAARQSLLHGGSVFLVEPEEMPCDAPAAAVFRY